MYRGIVSTDTAALGPPSGVLIEITSRCNLVCKMCPLTTGRTPSSQNPGPIDDALWAAVLPFAKQAGHANIGGYGEPLLNPKCLDYLRDLDREGIRTTLTTNGTLVTPAVAQGLAALQHLVSVNISIDSPDAAIYKSIRGGSVEKALAGVGHLAAALKPSQLTVSSVMMRSTLASLESFPAKLAAIGVRTYVLQGLVDYTPGLEPEETRWRDGLPAQVETMKQACRAAGVELVLELPERVAAELRDGNAAAREQNRTPAETDTRQCSAPWDVPVIDKDGRVFPCCYALSNATAVMGSLRESSAEAIWRGERFEAFRRDIVDGRTMPDVCRSCDVVPTGPHPFRLYAMKIVPSQSVLEGSSQLRLAVRNGGTATWTPDDMVRIGTAEPRDGHSAFYDQTWIGRNRICSFSEASVPPGGTATFEFTVNPHASVRVESFQLVVEHQCWIPGTRFEVRPGPAGPAATKERSLPPARGLGSILRRIVGSRR